MNTAQDLLADIARYYDSKVLAHGATALGVDWPAITSVHKRLIELLAVVDFDGEPSLNDLGCGWGAALEVIGHLHPAARVDYEGIDVAPAMIDAARARWAGDPRARFDVGSRCTRVANYTIASGIFNVKLAHPREEWEAHVRSTLEDISRHSTTAFAVNFMLPTPAREAVAQLYCTPPDPWVRVCESLGRRAHVAPLPGLGEFTLQVR